MRLAQDATRTSSGDDSGDDVVMGESNADEDRAEHPIPVGMKIRKRITMERESRAGGHEQTSTIEQCAAQEITKKKALSGHSFVVTTREATDGHREEAESAEQVTLVPVIRERRHKMTWAMLVPRKEERESSEVHRPAWAQHSLAQVRQRAGDRGTGEKIAQDQWEKASPVGSLSVRRNSCPARPEHRRLRWSIALGQADTEKCAAELKKMMHFLVRDMCTRIQTGKLERNDNRIA